MVALKTPICAFGSLAPDFALPNVQGEIVTKQQAVGPAGLLVMFICNHCPYVQAIITDLVQDVQSLQQQGIGVVAIMSNDVETYPADSPQNMKIFAEKHGFTFP